MTKTNGCQEVSRIRLLQKMITDMLIVLTQYNKTNRADENKVHEKKFRKVFKQVRTLAF